MRGSDPAPSGNRPATFLARQLRPEALLLINCARTHCTSVHAANIRSLASLPLDWDFLCDSADKHRLTQLLYKNLSAICPDSMPPEPRARLRHRFFTNAGSNLRLAHMLITLLEKFASEAVPVIPYKGSILANCTYGKLAFRQNYDLDLFIRQEDIDRCGQVLLAEGYECDEVFDREARYRHSESGVEVDVHWGFAPRYFHLQVDFDGLYSRAQTLFLLEQPVKTFSAEDFLQILCLQVIKDGWERRQQLEHLSKVCDIAEYIRNCPDIQWPRVFQSARSSGLLRIIHCSLILAQELLDAELPSEVVAEIAPDREARKRARFMCRSLFTDTDTLSPLENPFLSVGLRVRQLIFYLGVRERYRDRIQHIGEIFRFSSGA